MIIHGIEIFLSLLESVCYSMSSSNCCFLICIQISQEVGQVVWYFHLLKNFPQFVLICTVKHFRIINKVEIVVFLELSYFYYDPTNAGNLISGSSAFSNPGFNIWKFMVHILLKPGTGEFWALLWSCVRWMKLCSSLNIICHCPSLGLEWKLTFSSPVVTVSLSKLADILSATLSQHILLGPEYSLVGTPSPPLALCVLMLPKAHLTSHPRMSHSRWVIPPSWLSQSWRSFLV